MKRTALLAFSLFSFLVSGQSEQTVQCHMRKNYEQASVKSNSLSVAQIAETEKYDVHFYALDIAMNNLVTDVAGTAEIHGKTRVALDSVLFELFYTLNISEIRLNGVPVSFSRNNSAVKVPVNLAAGQPFIVAVDYDGTPPTAASNPLGGSGMTNASSPSWGNQVTWSLSESFAAYEWWPCKQSLTDKADSCSVKITVPSTCKAGSNGVLENVVDLGNGTSRYEWMHRHPIDYYLISVAVAEYVEYNVYANPVGSTGPVLVQNYVYNNPMTLPYFQADIDETADFIELYATLFGPYPFQDEKYGHCMAPISGGMEHQTMTTQGWFEKGLTAHELGHQWWGDHVTCASWCDIWINEGFASYSDYLMRENMYPSDAVTFMNDAHDNVMTQPGGTVWVLDSLNESAIFSGRLSYDKGAAIIHTMRFIMNDDAMFFDKLKEFQIAYADSTAKGIDIRDMLNTSGTDFTDAFDQWYFGEGFPTYSARWNASGSDLLLEVSHTVSATTPVFTNPIEVRLTRSGAPDTVLRVPITSNDDYFLIENIGIVTGLTAIDPNNWVINQVGTIEHDPGFLMAVNEISTNPLRIYPNPSEGLFTIECDIEGTMEIAVRDAAGKLVLNDTYSGNYQLDLSGMENGYYIVHLTDKNGFVRVKTISKK